MISVRFTPHPPGEPGMKVYYFMRKSRHRVAAPLSLCIAVLSGWSGWLRWDAGLRDGLTFLEWAVSLAGLVLAPIIWRHGWRVEQRLKREMRHASLAQKGQATRQLPEPPH
jgi:hypothetical protein